MKFGFRLRLIGLPQLLGTAVLLATPAVAADSLKIGVIAEAQAIAGASIPQAAQMAADDINAHGGVDGRKIEIISLRQPLVLGGLGARLPARGERGQGDRGHRQLYQRSRPGARALVGASAHAVHHAGRRQQSISKSVHDDYEHNKYTFHGYLTSAFLAQSICDYSQGYAGRPEAHEDRGHHERRRRLDHAARRRLSRNACRKIGLKVLDHIRFSPDTTDFTPIFNKIEDAQPDVIITGISHVGVQPTVQWKNQQVPIPMFGISSQATNETFGKDTNGAAEGVLYQGVSGPNVARDAQVSAVRRSTSRSATATTRPMSATRLRRGLFHCRRDRSAPGLDRCRQAGRPRWKRPIWEGTIGRVQFYGKDDQFTHSIKYGQGLITGLMLQWQNGKQVVRVAEGSRQEPRSSSRLRQGHRTELDATWLPGRLPGS